jgi:serine/threonine protein kinase
LKANNIMSHNGTYKIIDFGLSKKLQISHELNEVNGSYYMGALTTMAPEVMSKQPYGLKVNSSLLRQIFGL